MPDDNELIPVSERCVMAIADLLRVIKTDDGEYSNDAIVERHRPDGNAKGVEDATLQIVLEEDVPVDDPSIAPGTLAGYRMEVSVFFYPLHVEDGGEVDAQAVGRAKARAYADVRKALEKDRNLGGLAMVANLMPPESGWTLGSQPATRLPITVIFWTDQDDPYRQSWRN